MDVTFPQGRLPFIFKSASFFGFSSKIDTSLSKFTLSLEFGLLKKEKRAVDYLPLKFLGFQCVCVTSGQCADIFRDVVRLRGGERK